MRETKTKKRSLIFIRSHPVTHYPVDSPLCAECAALGLTFFDPSCAGCAKALRSAGADIAHVFAALRQWVPQVRNMNQMNKNETFFGRQKVTEKEKRKDYEGNQMNENE